MEQGTINVDGGWFAADRLPSVPCKEGAMDVATRTQVNLVADARPAGDYIFVPTGSGGGPGELFRYVADQLTLTDDVLPSESELSAGFSFRPAEPATLAFIVTISAHGPVNRNLKVNLRAALTQLPGETSLHLWIPLMGTGAGGISYLTSLAATLEAIRGAGLDDNEWITVTISAPPGISSAELTALAHVFQKWQAPAQESGTDETSLQHTDELDGLFRMAAGIWLFHKPDPTSITTSVLFLALCVCNRNDVPDRLRRSRAAHAFADAVGSLAGSKVLAVWHSYFGKEFDDTALQTVPSTARHPFSLNVETWLRRAEDLARAENLKQVEVAHLIEALWDLPPGSYKRVLHAMDLELPPVKSAYLSRMSDPGFVPGHSGDVFVRFLHDCAGSKDLMEFDQYAEAIRQFLGSPDTEGPISISIQAPWGAGKSTLMRLIRDRIDPPAHRKPVHGKALIADVLRFLKHGDPAEPETNRQWTVWFNVWKYESSEQVWAGLVDAIVSQVSERLPAHERELFLLRLNLSRIDDGAVRNKIHDRLAASWWIGARWILLMASTVVATIIALGSNIAALASAVTLGGGAMVAWLARTWNALKQEPATFSLAEYIRIPDYAKSVGILHQIHSDLQKVVSALPTRYRSSFAAYSRSPLVIFIDDLDRCSPNKVASIVEGINSFLASDQPEFMFIIGMDPQMIAAALEHAHKDVRASLPPHERHVPLGWRFMDKFVQLAFTIPPRTGGAIRTYVDRILAPLPSAAQPGSPVPHGGHPDPAATAHIQPAADERARSTEIEAGETEILREKIIGNVTAENADVQEVLRGILKDCHCSPREIKRMLNLVRFVLYLRANRIARGDVVPGLALYRKWIYLNMRWPDFMRWLQWSTDTRPFDAPGGSFAEMPAQRLHVLELSAQTFGADQSRWRHTSASTLGLDPEGICWLSDSELYRFFTKEAALPPADRISSGAETGFY